MLDTASGDWRIAACTERTRRGGLVRMQLFGKAWWAGVASGVVVTTMIVEPRLATSIMLLVLLLTFIEHILRRGLKRAPSTFDSVFLLVIVFSGWAMLSAAWSPAPWHSLLKPTFTILIALTVWLALRTVSAASRPVAHYVGEGALTAVVIGYVLVCFEILTDQLITRSIMTTFPSTHANLTKHVTVADDGTVIRVSKANLNRRMGILTWLMWPAIMLALHDPNKIRRGLSLAVIAAGAAIILGYGTHQSSQIAILGGLIVYGLAWVNLNLLRTAVSGAWAVAVVLAVPLALIAFQANMHHADWLFKSARHRVVIWGTTAEEVLKSPILGVGADATRDAMPKVTKKSLKKRNLGQFKSGYANHAHNAYLQVWYELGAVGAALFLALGLLAMAAIAKLKAAVQPSAIAVFVTTALLIAFSYSIWQPWFMAALGIAIAVLAVAIRKRGDQLAHPGTDEVPASSRDGETA